MASIDFPSSPSDGQTLVANGLTYVYVAASNVWNLLISEVAGPTGPQGKFTVSSTAPIPTTNGDGWYNQDNGKLYMYYEDGTSDQWVQVGNANVAAGTVSQSDLDSVEALALLGL